MRGGLVRRAGLLLAAAIVAGAVLVVGGNLAVVSTYGNSMEPGFHAGDLALLTPTSQYAVGDIAGYHSDDLDTVVMHRIVAVDAGRYVLQGDNNSWLDPEQPTADEMVGTLALHIPQGGLWLGRLTAPPALALYAFGLMASGGAVQVRRRGRRRPVPPTTPQRTAARPSSSWQRLRPGHVAATAVTVAVLGALLIALATTRPLRVPGPVEYRQQATFAYAADAPAGPVYPDGEVRTGDTVFLQVVDRLDVTAEWQLEPTAGHPAPTIEGTADLSLVVADGTGWHHSLPIDTDVTVTGATATLGGQIDLARVQRTVAAAQAATGASGGSQTLALMADIHVTGQVSGQAMESEFQPEVVLDLDALRLRPPSATDASAEPFRVAQTDNITVPGAQDATIGLLGRDLPLVVARGVGMALAALAVVLGVVAVVLRRLAPKTAEEQVRARYGHLLVDALGYEAAAGRTIAELDAMEGLAMVAERLQLPIVTVPLRDGGRLYTVDDLQTQYRYRSGPAAPIEPPSSSHEGRGSKRRPRTRSRRARLVERAASNA